MGPWAWTLGVWALLAPLPVEARRTSAVTGWDLVLARHLPLDDVDPTAAPIPWVEGSPLTIVAASGER